MNNWKDQLVNLLYTGNVAAVNMQQLTAYTILPYPQDVDIEVTMSLLERGATEAYDVMLEILVDITTENHATGMVRIGLANLLSKVPDDFFQLPTNIHSLHYLLINMNCKELKELVELLRDKSFGKGFGSRPQKMIRKTMEAWTVEHLKTAMITESKDLYILIKLVHPRYHGSRAEIIKELLME